jgi:hypothetical protein
VTAPRQFTVLRKTIDKPGEEDLVYRGGSLDLATEAATAAVRWPDIPRAVIYEDRLDPADKIGPERFVFVGESWGWVDATEHGPALHDVKTEAAIAARKLDDELQLHRRALIAHLRDVPHRVSELGFAQPSELTLGEDVISTLINLDVSIAIEGLEKIHRLWHPGEADPFHSVKP